MEQQLTNVHDIYPHIRTVMGMVVGLGVARLLSGIARIIQHPGQYRISAVHLAWVLSMLLALVHFWWWQFGLYQITSWTFGIYAFLIGYAIVLFLVSALLFPDSMQDYKSYEDFFFSRRKWFFGLLALTFALDIVDTLIKGEAHFARFGIEYYVRTPILIALCLAGIISNNRRFHVALVAAMLIYQVSWIYRLFDTIA